MIMEDLAAFAEMDVSRLRAMLNEAADDPSGVFACIAEDFAKLHFKWRPREAATWMRKLGRVNERGVYLVREAELEAALETATGGVVIAGADGRWKSYDPINKAYMDHQS